MKPETKKTRRRTNADEEGGASPFNLGSLKKAIEAIDEGRKENSINLSSLSVALSAASREMKQTGKSHRVRETRKKKEKKKMMMMKDEKLAIVTKPKTNAKLRKWFSNLDKSIKELSVQQPRELKLSLQLKETQICVLNTDFTMNHCLESFR